MIDYEEQQRREKFYLSLYSKEELDKMRNEGYSFADLVRDGKQFNANLERGKDE